MSIERNKALMLRVFDEVLNKGNLAVLDEVTVPNFVVHYATPGFAPDLAGYKQYVKAIRTAFPDIKFVAEELIAEGDKIVARYTMTGTHKGPMASMPNVPPTNKVVKVTGIVIGRFDANGKGMEIWGEFDQLGMLQQLGLVPVPA